MPIKMAAPMRNVLRQTSWLFGQNRGIIGNSAINKSCLSRMYANRSIFTSQRKFASSFNWSICRRFTLLSAGVGLSVYVSDLWRRTGNARVLADQGGPPKFKPIRKIRSDTDTTGLKLTLFQYQTCPFCCKVRAYLDYHGFSYDVIEVNSVWRTQIKWTKYKKVPILVCHGMGEEGYLQLNDSSVIISALETFLVDQDQPLDKIVTYYPSIESKNEKGKTVIDFPNKYFIMYMDKESLPATPKERKEEREWRAWVDEVLVHSLSPNIYRTPREALQSFRYFSEIGEWEKVFTTPERLVVIYVGAVAMYAVGKLLKKRHNLKDDVRESLYDDCNKWTQAIGKKRKFMGGHDPNLADLSVYGVLSAIEGCQAFQELLKNTNIGPWYRDTKEAVEIRGGSLRT